MVVLSPGLPIIQFFDCLQYAKSRGEKLGTIYHVSATKVDRGGVVPNQKSTLEALLCSVDLSVRVLKTLSCGQ